MTTYRFGSIDGIKEGDSFPSREALRDAWIHRKPVDGIDGNPTEGSSSIVLNGGYVDDLDLGEEIIYTGHGGKDPNSNKQIKDQNWDDTGNKALIVSELKGLPVRVTRGYKNKSEYSPKAGYTYGGIYYVTEHFQDTGENGFKICRYRLIKASTVNSDRTGNQLDYLSGENENKRIKTTIFRIIRDTKLSKSIKETYNYTCQICGIRIAVRNIPYAEGAHIKPIGRPHNGSDEIENLLCLCPNHHVMLDKGAITINDNLTLRGISGTLTMHDDHSIKNSNLEYHRNHIFIDEI